MKKKLFILLSLFALSMVLAACGGKEPEAGEPATTSDVGSITPEEDNEATGPEESPDSAQPEEIPESNAEPENIPEPPLEDEKTEKTLDDLEAYLSSQGLLSGERVQMGADLIGAVAGFKYKGSIGEIYEYDTGAEEYKKLSNGEEIPIKGMEGYTMKAISINGKFVLFGDDAPQDLIDAFNAFE